MPSSLRAFITAFIQPLLPLSACPFLNIFLDTTLPFLLSIRSAFVRPPLVHLAVPFHTLRMDPVCIFFVTRFGFFTLVRRSAFFDAFGALGLTALAALGALGFWAFLAALRVARLAARFLAERGFEARRTAALTAILL